MGRVSQVIVRATPTSQSRYGMFSFSGGVLKGISYTDVGTLTDLVHKGSTVSVATASRSVVRKPPILYTIDELIRAALKAYLSGNYISGATPVEGHHRVQVVYNINVVYR